MFISYVTGREGRGGGGSRNSARNHEVFSLMAYQRFSSAVLASFQFHPHPYAVPANYSQVKRQLFHCSLLQSPQNLKVESRMSIFSPFLTFMFTLACLGGLKKFRMLNHRLADTINIPVVTCDVVHSIRQFQKPTRTAKKIIKLFSFLINIARWLQCSTYHCLQGHGKAAPN